MVDFNLEEKLKKGISFSDLFKSLFLYSTSIFIAFYWSDLLKETLMAWFPSGQGIIMKVSVGTLATIILIMIAYILMHSNKHRSRLNGSNGNSR